jgi:hypothetical protein
VTGGSASLRPPGPPPRSSPAAGRGQGGVLAQDAALELAQRRAGLDTQVAGQDGAQVAIGAQRFGLAPGPVQRQHPVRPQPLAEGMRGGERFEFPDQLPVAAAGQQCLGPRLQRREPPFLQSARLRLRERRVVHVGQGRATPQARCLVQPAGRERAVPGRQRRLPVPGQALEPRRIQLAGRHPDQVTRRPRHQPVRLAGCPQRLA